MSIDANSEFTGIIQENVSDKEQLYGEVMLHEAQSLLKRYLPEALPQEPTELFVDIQPGYRGKFRGKHYIAREDISQIAAMEDLLENNRELSADIKHHEELEREWWDIMESFLINKETVTEEDMAELRAMEEQFFSSKQEPTSQMNSVPETKDWEDPEKLLQNEDGFSKLTWKGVYILIHELIHQRQAETNPHAFPELSSKELNSINIETIPRGELKLLLEDAHRSKSKEINEDSIYYPVIEGTAVTGTFYVLSRLIDDLTKSGQIETARKIRQVIGEKVRLELASPEKRRKDYNGNYVEGTQLVKRLYKKIGIESGRRLLTNVDLRACQEIIKGSERYQLALENPELLPTKTT